MADMMSILQASYQSAGLTLPSNTKYVNVDPALYKGTWTAKYANGKSLTIGISEVSGFRAKVRFQMQGAPVLSQQVLIKDGSFRIGDNKFFLQKNGTAMIRSVVTNTATGGQSLETTYAKQG
jgi:hypothetical protein